MGVASAIVLGLAAASAAGSIYSGVQAKKEGKKQARLASEQAGLAAAETERQAERSTLLEKRNIADVTERQRLAYLASGVTLEGSPLLKLEETRRLGAENIEEIQKAGAAGSEAQLAEGRMTAQASKARGRQALISGISSAAGTLARAAG